MGMVNILRNCCQFVAYFTLELRLFCWKNLVSLCVYYSKLKLDEEEIRGRNKTPPHPSTQKITKNLFGKVFTSFW